MDGDDGGTGFTCNICFESADKDPIVTPCGHLYCKSCIYTWLRNPRHDSQRCPCPVCNAVIKEKNLIPLYGIGKSQSHKKSVDSADSPERQAGQKSATTSAPNRPTPSAPEWPTDPRPAPSAPKWPTNLWLRPATTSAPLPPTYPRPATPSAPLWSTVPTPAAPSASDFPADQTLAIPSTANVILTRVCRLLIRVGQCVLVRIIEIATDKLIEAVEMKINELNEAAEERDNVNGEGSGNSTASSEEVEERNGEGSDLGPWVVLNST